MALQSKLFRDDPRLQRCLIDHAAHVTPGSVGDHVHKIQTALILLDDLVIDSSEIMRKEYGPSTTGAVLAFKRARNIINYSYETQVDNIVGKMTIAAMDIELVQAERTRALRDTECRFLRDPNSRG